VKRRSTVGRNRNGKRNNLKSWWTCIHLQKQENVISKIYQFRKEFKPSVTLCKDKDGNIISDPQDIRVLAQWNGYFDDLLNKNINIEGINEENQDIQQLNLNNEEHLEVPTYQEII
jgi:hypothetical protein